MPRYIQTHRSKDLKRSVLVIANFLIKELKVHKEYKLNYMYSFLKNKLGIQPKDFIYTLNFLYILGKITYTKDDDLIRYNK